MPDRRQVPCTDSRPVTRSLARQFLQSAGSCPGWNIAFLTRTMAGVFCVSSQPSRRGLPVSMSEWQQSLPRPWLLK